MPIIDSATGKIVRNYALPELVEAAKLMRGYNLVALAAAGSGHAGGTLSIMDVTAALYLHVANHDPKCPFWEDRDRIIWSTGHKAPNLYIGLGMAGYFDIEDVARLRKLGSPYQGHPHWPKLPGVEASTGSLGQGLSIAVGIALAGKLDKKDYHVYCLMGDGEQQEGQIWEAAMEAGHFKLDNLTGIVDKNQLQIDGWVKDVMNIDPLDEKYRSFGWEVIEIDGHDMQQILEAFDKAKNVKGKPTVIIANTVKGKGVDFMENVAGWHGKSPNYEEMMKGLEQLGIRDRIPVERMMRIAKDYQAQVDKELAAKMPKFSRDYWWNSGDTPPLGSADEPTAQMKVNMEPTRKGFGKALSDKGNDERIVCIGMDISGSITISDFYTGHPERKSRWISVGIAEQSGTAMAAGLAKEGKIPCLERTEHLRQHEILTRFAQRSATATSTSSSLALMVASLLDLTARPIKHWRICSRFAVCRTCMSLFPAMFLKQGRQRSICCLRLRDPNTFALLVRLLRSSQMNIRRSSLERQTSFVIAGDDLPS